MPNISSFKTSSRFFALMSSSVSTRQHSFLSQFMMSITIVVLLVAFSPCVSSSPTPSSSSTNEHNNKINDEQNGFMFDPNDYQSTSTGDSSLSSNTVQHSLSGSSPFWYVQPRTNANQFLMSHINDNEVIVPKWFARLNNHDQGMDNNKNNDDDLDDYFPSAMSFNKRSKFVNNGGLSNIKKRKQLAKPPMEVMNEIVNSIYLKR